MLFFPVLELLLAKTSFCSMKSIVYISDFRDIPLTAAFSIFHELKRKGSNVELWVSKSKSKGEYDFGDHLLSQTVRKFRYRLLMLFNVKEVQLDVLKSFKYNDNGIISPCKSYQ